MSTVAILGASSKTDRYSFRAQKLLMEKGHRVVPLSPGETSILGVECFRSIKDFQDPVDTVTLYVRPSILETVLDEVIEKRPRRVIFNPGTECPVCWTKLNQAGIATEEACTLVLLSSDQF